MYYGTVVSCSYVVPENLVGRDKQTQLQDLLERAVARTVLQQSVLQAGLAGSEPGAPDSHFIALGRVDLGHQITWHIAESAAAFEAKLDHVLQKELDSKFVNRDVHPAWRLVAVRQCDTPRLEVMFNFHHPVTDGTGAKLFHQYLLRNLNSASISDKDLDAVLGNHVLLTPSTADTFPPSQDHMAEYPLTLKHRAAALWETWKPNFLQNTDHLAQWAPLDMDRYKTIFRRVTIDSETLQKVLAVCRTHKTTVTGLMHAIIVISLSARLPDKSLPGFAGQTPTNMRTCTPGRPDAYPNLVPADTIGVIVSVVTHVFGSDTVSEARKLFKAGKAGAKMESLQSLLWKIAAKTKDEIKEGVALGTTDNLVGDMASKPDFIDSLNARIGKPRGASWMVTNLGVLDGQGTPGDWAIDGSSFTVCAERTGSAISMSLVAVKGRNLCIDLSWQETVVDPSVGDGLVTDTEDWLAFIAG